MNHAIERVEHTIEMDESLNLHETAWTIQRIGWTCFLLIVILSGLGLFGTGILSHQKAETAGNMIEYDRYGRFENTTHLHLQANSENGQAIVYIPQQYLKKFELEQITPEPFNQSAADGYYAYTFLADGPVHIMLRGMPKKTGSIEATLRINNIPLYGDRKSVV